MVQTKGFILEEDDGQYGEHGERDGFLYYLELPKVVRTTVSDIADSVSRNHEAVFKRRNCPAQDDDQRQRQFAEPRIALKFQVAVPGKEHEHIGA